MHPVADRRRRAARRTSGEITLIRTTRRRAAAGSSLVLSVAFANTRCARTDGGESHRYSSVSSGAAHLPLSGEDTLVVQTGRRDGVFGREKTSRKSPWSDAFTRNPGVFHALHS